MYENYYAVIMAGGGGTRLWPLSRRSRPKQMLSLFEERSLFQTAVERLDGLFSPDRIFVVTVAAQAVELQAQCPQVPVENYLIEPMPRGTASVVGLAAAILARRDPRAVMAVLTSDHFIGNEERFLQLLRAAYDAAQEDFLVTLGIEPTFPATGFGYIHQGDLVGAYGGLEVFQVLRFREKPDEDDARRMLASGDYSWNSGMFVWKVSRILSEFERQMPELFTGLQAIQAAARTENETAVVEQVWTGLTAETIDYGIMEGAGRVVVIPAAGLKWNDVGSWDSLFDVLDCDAHGNIVMGGAHIGVDTQKSLVYMNQEHRLIVTIGVENLVVVDTGDVLMVCHKDQAQRVREVVKKLQKDGQEYI